MKGFLLIDKTEGMTSHDVVNIIRRALGLRQVGHTGTLDPMATGVLPICVGQATRMSQYLLAGEKQYEATLKLGIETDTYDRNGTVTMQLPYDVTLDQLQEVLDRRMGPQLQIPPMFSAKKKDGKKLYEMARQGIEIEREPVPIEIFSLDLLSFTPPELTLRVHASKGTYIRSLAYDIGRDLGTCAHLTSLRRIEAGGFTIDQCTSIDTVKGMDRSEIERLILPMDIVLLHVEKIVVDDAEAKKLCHGQRVPYLAGDCDLLRVYDSQNRFLGPGSIVSNEMKLKKVMI